MYELFLRHANFMQEIFPCGYVVSVCPLGDKGYACYHRDFKERPLFTLFQIYQRLVLLGLPQIPVPSSPPREMEGRWEGHGRDTVETRYIHGGGTEGTRSGERELRFVILGKFLSKEFVHQFHCILFLFIHDFGIDLCR